MNASSLFLEATMPAKAAAKPVADPAALSEEDAALKEALELIITRLHEAPLRASALSSLRQHIRSSTSTMTAVPKPLKFLLPHVKELRGMYEIWPDCPERLQLADILSVLVMTDAESHRDTLRFHLLGTRTSPGDWGHEYVRHLAAEIGKEYDELLEEQTTGDIEQIRQLAISLVPYFLKHNAEAEAVDLLLEVEAIEEIIEHLDESTYSRVCLYIVSCSNYLSSPDDVQVLVTASKIYEKFGKIIDAFRLSIKMHNRGEMQRQWDACSDRY